MLAANKSEVAQWFQSFMNVLYETDTSQHEAAGSCFLKAPGSRQTSASIDQLGPPETDRSSIAMDH